MESASSDNFEKNHLAGPGGDPIDSRNPMGGNNTLEPIGDKSDDEIGFQSLDPNWIRADRFAGLIFSGFLTLAGLIGLIVFTVTYWRFDWLWWLVLGGGAVLILLSFLYSIFWPSIAYRYIRWRLSDHGLEIRQGVFWRHRISVPVNRVQHTDIQQGPLQRLFELGTLVVNTAGTENASVPLSGLSHQTAEALRDELVRQREAADVA